ncbi:MAG: toll/interleukin-1 receptor domain-containing protein, partial [bacterium]|nr:toll/interleukin-1 receptor domain-containing protein [bacterium]
MPTSFQYDVLLCHATADKPAVESLARKLRDDDLKPFLDKWHLIPGQPWQDALEKALEDSRSVAVFLGPGGLGPWQHEEMRAALHQRVKGTLSGVIPVLLPGAREKHVPPFLARMTWVDFRSGLDNEDAFHYLVCGIRGVAPEAGAAAAVVPYRSMAQRPEGFVERRELEKIIELLCAVP